MNTHIHHFTAGARGSEPLVDDDEDRHALLASMRRALGERVLGYCVMGTHAHVVAEGGAAPLARRLEHELVTYTRAFNRRHGRRGRLLRGPVAWAPRIECGRELARALHYVHENPLQTRTPLVAHAHEYPWSSRRAFAGLSLATHANTGRARELLGKDASWISGPRIRFADVDPVPAPTVGLATLLGAAAQVFGVPPASILDGRRTPEVQAARALFVQLARLEAFSLSQTGGFLGRDKSMCCRLAARPVPVRALEIARTLTREPALRAWIESAAAGGHNDSLQRGASRTRDADRCNDSLRALSVWESPARGARSPA